MVIVSCSGKFHAFALAEQLQKHNQLQGLYTSYAFQKNIWMRRLAKRIDKESISPSLIHTNIPLAFLMKGLRREALVYHWNNLFDKWVARQIAKNKNYKILIGWSGMSLHSIREAKSKGKITILERGSSHILYQNKILKEEYQKFGINFQINERVIEKELMEYEEADYISIPSLFVKNSFLEHGVDEKKLVHNPYGTSSFFLKHSGTGVTHDNKFRILYLGGINIRKGLIYLFEALHALNLPRSTYEVWFIGSISEEMRATVEKYRLDNWRFFGHINHYDLPSYLSACDVAIQPSNEEGLSMVIAQMLACGVPVIASENSGGRDIITDNVNGYIVPIRSPLEIRDKIYYLYNNPDVLALAKNEASKGKNLSWDSYGDRYYRFINSL